MGKFADELNASLQEALAHAEGQTGTTTSHVVMVPDDVDVGSIRKWAYPARPSASASAWRCGLYRIGSKSAAARAYLMVIAHNPAAVEAALQTA
jgi:hypothetical protein